MRQPFCGCRPVLSGNGRMKTEEERKCIVSGEILEKANLLRFTVLSDGRLIPDFKKRLPGRGVYVRNSRQILEIAAAKNLFSKAVKKHVKLPENLPDMVGQILRKSALEIISLARKAGVLVTGMEKVRETIVKGKAAFLLEASDAGADGHNKLRSLAGNLEIFDLYKTEELDKALDRVNTVHVAFKKSEMADAVYNDLKKIENFENS